MSNVIRAMFSEVSVQFKGLSFSKKLCSGFPGTNKTFFLLVGLLDLLMFHFLMEFLQGRD